MTPITLCVINFVRFVGVCYLDGKDIGVNIIEAGAGAGLPEVLWWAVQGG